MPIYAFRAKSSTTLYGVGNLADARRYESMLNRDRQADRYKADPASDGEIALYSGKVFFIKQGIVRRSLGKE